MDFTNKCAIATGAASGMGLLFCQEFVKLGGNVLMCDANEQEVMKKADEINADYPGHAVGFCCDVRDYAQVCKARDTAVEKFGNIDVMVNFAGGAEMRV